MAWPRLFNVVLMKPDLCVAAWARVTGIEWERLTVHDIIAELRVIKPLCGWGADNFHVSERLTN